MQLMQRLGSETDFKYMNDVLDVIMKNPGSCDNVWFPTLYGFPPMEKHRETPAEYCFCRRGEEFKSYLLETLSVYAEIKPDHIRIDDDFRPTNHAPRRIRMLLRSLYIRIQHSVSDQFHAQDLGAGNPSRGHFRQRKLYCVHARGFDTGIASHLMDRNDRKKAANCSFFSLIIDRPIPSAEIHCFLYRELFT